MLNKTNRKLYRSLRGEYKRYARRLKDTLFDCCRGKAAVNDSLSDVFTMLAEAQGAHRAFADVIPDPHASIRETALCFPARRMRRNTAVILCLCAALVLLAGSAVAIELSGDVWLSQPIPYYDAEQNIVYWQPVEHAQGYKISVNGSEVGTTDKTIFRLEGDIPEEYIVIQVTATAGGRYRESSGFVDYLPIVQEEHSVNRSFSLSQLFSDGGTATFAYPAGIYENIRIEITPEVNAYVRPEGTVLGLYKGSLETDTEDLGQPLAANEYVLLRAEADYLLLLDPQPDYTDVEARVRLADPLAIAGEGVPVPDGLTLFATADPDPEENIAMTADEFRFAYMEYVIDLGSPSGLQWMDSFYPQHLGGYYGNHFWLVDNLAQERPLTLKERLQEIDVTAERKTLNVPSGWSTYRFLIAREQLDDNFRNWRYFMLYKSTEDALELRRPTAEKVEFHVSHGSLAACDFIFYPGLSESDPLEFIISAFNPSEDAVQITYEIMPEIGLTQEMLAQGTITLQPGITYIENETAALIVARAEQEFSAHEYAFLRLDSYNLIAAQYFPFERYAYFFNPHDEPLTLKLAAYYPQTN